MRRPPSGKGRLLPRSAPGQFPVGRLIKLLWQVVVPEDHDVPRQVASMAPALPMIASWADDCCLDRLSAISALVAAVIEGSLAAGARRLSLSPASMSRAIATLETRVGTKLLHRTSHVLRLTEAGTMYFEVCRQVVDLLENAERNAETWRDAPNATLSLEAPFVLGSVLLRPALDQFLVVYPAVRARLKLALDRSSDLIEDAIDIALRAGELPDSNLVATKVGELRWVVCAAPSYLSQHGVPDNPFALVEHRCISSSDGLGGDHWRFRLNEDLIRSVAIQPQLIVSGHLAAIDSALEGRGITRVLSFSVLRHLGDGTLVPLLLPFAPPASPVHLVTTRAAMETAKVRTLMSFAAPLLRAALTAAAEVS